MAILQEPNGAMGVHRHILRKIRPDCHPDRNSMSIGDHVVADVVTKVVNKIVDYFTEKKLWHHPHEWEKHIDYLIRQNEI
jgi:hypothetical protein